MIIGIDLEAAIRVIYLSAIPFIELRVGIPYGLARGLPPLLAIALGIAGTLLEFSVSFVVLVLLRRWRHRMPMLDRMFTYLDRRAEQRSRQWVHLGAVGLVLGVAAPIPGTGSWTGIAIAQLLGMSLPLTFVLVALGIALSGAFVGAVATGVFEILNL